MKKFALLAVALLLIATMPVLADGHDMEEKENLIATAIAVNAEGDFAGSFDTLIAVLQAEQQQIDRLTSRADFTVFAPTDDAFAALFDELGVSAEEVLADTDLLTKVLETHIVRNAYEATEVIEQSSLRTVNRNRLGVMGTQLMDPSDRTANIIVTDVMASNGVIHAIDTVLLPQMGEAPDVRATARNSVYVQPQDSIVQTAIDVNTEGPYAGQFDTLIAALQAQGDYLDALNDGGRFTVFAPTDDAFEKTFSELGLTAETVLADQELLTSVLGYHVTYAPRPAERLTRKSGIRMITGERLAINGASLTDGQGRIANIIVTDIEAANGIIHVIDNVVLP